MGELYFLVDDNGEVKNRIDLDTHSIKIRSKAQDEGYKKQQKKKSNMDFTLTNMEEIKTVISQMSDTHCGYLLFLQCFIDYDGRLIKPTHDKEPMTKLDVQILLGLGKTQFYEFFNAAIELGVIYDNEYYYYINPEYHLKGATENKKIVRTFTYKVRQLYTKRNAKDLGFIYKVLPYIHYITNTICFNPYDPIEDIKEMTQIDIAEITEVDCSTIYRKMKKLKLGDEFVFAEINVGVKKSYTINPFLFYRGEGNPDAKLREIFILGKVRRNSN